MIKLNNPFPNYYDFNSINSNVLSKIGGNIINSQSSFLYHNHQQVNEKEKENERNNISQDISQVSNNSKQNKGNNFLSFFLINSPNNMKNDTNRFNKKSYQFTNSTRQPRQIPIKKDYKDQMSSIQNSINNNLFIQPTHLTNYSRDNHSLQPNKQVETIPKDLANEIVDTTKNELRIKPETIFEHSYVWEEMFTLELNIESKIIMNLTVKTLLHHLNDTVNKTNSFDWDIFETQNINKCYQKLMKICYLIIIFLKFVLSDFNYETTIKSQIKKMLYSFNNELIYIIEHFIQPSSNDLFISMQAKDFYDKYINIIKIHRMTKNFKLKEPLHKAIDGIINLIKLFSK
jgi:hypothetical protein